MKPSTMASLIKFVLLLIVLYFLYSTGFIYGLAGTLAVIAYFAYSKRNRIYTFLGRIGYANGDMEKAIKWYGKAASMQGASPDVITSYCYLLLKKGETDAPEKMLNDLIARFSVSEDKKMVAKSIKALIEWKRGHLDEAISMLEEALEKVETSNMYGSLGYLLIQKGDLDRALEFNLKAYDYNSTNDVILDNLGQTYYLRGEYDKALEIYQKLMEKKPKPTFPEAYYNYGLLLFSMDKRDEALEKMKEALNYKLSFLSTISAEEIQNKINEIETEKSDGMEETDEQ